MRSAAVHSGTALIAGQPVLLLSGEALAAGMLTGYLGRILKRGGIGPSNNWLFGAGAHF